MGFLILVAILPVDLLQTSQHIQQPLEFMPVLQIILLQLLDRPMQVVIICKKQHMLNIQHLIRYYRQIVTLRLIQIMRHLFRILRHHILMLEVLMP